MVTGGSLSSTGGGVPQQGRPPRAGEAPARSVEGPQVSGRGRKGLTAAPFPGFTRAQSLGRGRGSAPRAPPPRPPTHTRTQLAHPPTLARTTASGSTHAATPVVSHVTHDARASAARGGAPPGVEQWDVGRLVPTAHISASAERGVPCDFDSPPHKVTNSPVTHSVTRTQDTPAIHWLKPSLVQPAPQRTRSGSHGHTDTRGDPDGYTGTPVIPCVWRQGPLHSQTGGIYRYSDRATPSPSRQSKTQIQSLGCQDSSCNTAIPLTQRL